MRILIVEDDASLAAGITQILQGDGHAVDTMKSGEQALLATGLEHFGLVILDIGLPGIDGFEVLRRLRADPGTAAIPCIALSANAMPEDIERGLAAGFADYWTKPIDFTVFIAALHRLFPAAVAGAAESAAHSPGE